MTMKVTANGRNFIVNTITGDIAVENVVKRMEFHSHTVQIRELNNRVEMLCPDCNKEMRFDIEESNAQSVLYFLAKLPNRCENE